MARNPLSLASGVVPEFGPEATVEAALAGGFDAVGLWVEPDKWQAGTVRAVRKRGDGRMPVLDVEVVWIKPGAANPDHLRIIDIGAELGAKNVLTVSSDPDIGATTAKFVQLCEHAHGCGMRAVLEFGVFTEVKTLDAALAIVKESAHPAAGLLLDPIHLSRSGGTPADIAKIPPASLPYAQFCDAPAKLPDLTSLQSIIEDAVDLRELPGEGALPLQQFVHALPAGLPLSVELRSKALRETWPDANDRARALAKATRRYLSGL